MTIQAPRGFNVETLKISIEISEKYSIFYRYPELEVYHVNLAFGVCPCFVVKNEVEAIFFTPKEDSFMFDRKKTGLRINCGDAVYAKTS